jgi:hypothetical protein
MDISNTQLQGIQSEVSALAALVNHADGFADGHIAAIVEIINQVRNAPPKLVAQGGIGHSRPAPKPEPKKKKGY